MAGRATTTTTTTIIIIISHNLLLRIKDRIYNMREREGNADRAKQDVKA